MTLALDPDDPRSPSAQVADALRRGIRDGVYAPGERLPSVAELKASFGVASGTVQSALRTLREEGLIMSWQGRGIYVRKADTPSQAAPDLAELVRVVDQLADRIQGIAERLAQVEEHLDHQGKTAESP